MELQHAPVVQCMKEIDDSHRDIKIYLELFVSESSAVQILSWWEFVLLSITEIP